MITLNNLNNEAFIHAIGKLRELYGNKPEAWFTTCKTRLLDVMYVGKNEKKKDKFHVLKNEKLGDKYKQRFKTVILSGMWRFCTCTFGKYGARRFYNICTHVGACLLYRWYYEFLKIEMPVEMRAPNELVWVDEEEIK